MASAQRLKQRLLTEIERLPEDQLGEVLDFVGFLLSKKEALQTGDQDRLQSGPLVSDPLQRFIGGVGHSSLTQQIDEDVYGD